MTISHRSVLLAFLEEIDAVPRKSLSQNFLIDANIVRKIADAAEIKKGDHVLEIGPGPGALTQELLERGARVFAVEKDPRFALALQRLQKDDHLQIYREDILSFPLQQLQKYAPLKVVANLPYSITTPILEQLSEFHSLFSFALVMVQKEVADRMIAQPNTKEISSFTIFLKTYCTASVAFKVSKHCFHPAPQIDSSIVKLAFHMPHFNDPKPFLAWVRKAYQQRRKMLRSTLSIQGPYADKRPEMLSFEEWVALYSCHLKPGEFDKAAP